METISFINKKGGVGKTTIAVHFAYLLAQKCEAKVLFIDNDDQGNASKYLCPDILKNEVSNIPTVSDFYFDHRPVSDCISKSKYANIDVIVNDISFSRLEVDNDFPITYLQNALERVADQYHFCVIDCPPATHLAVRNALAASNKVIIPAEATTDCIEGIDNLKSLIEVAVSDVNPGIQSKILFNKFHSYASCQETLEKFTAAGYDFTGEDFYATRIPLQLNTIKHFANVVPFH